MNYDDPPIITPKQWDACVAAVTDGKLAELAKWRGWKLQTCQDFKDAKAIGIYNGCWAFPNIDADGDIRSIHYRIPEANRKATWRHYPTGAGTHALVLGADMPEVAFIHESQWDLGTQLNLIGIEELRRRGWQLIATRGATGAKTLKELELPYTVYLIPQTDEAGQGLIDNVLTVLSRSVLVVAVPKQYKDLNDWGRDGLTADIFARGITDAVLRSPLRETGGGEFGEFSSLLPVQWSKIGENSPISPGGVSQKAFFPSSSILADYYEYAITQSEGADTYIIGAILPVVAALLARNVWTPWAAYDGRLHPNIYSILAGPPGNLKTTSIIPAESIAIALLEKNRFLPRNYSPEAIFDSFFKQPDRFLVCSDAGSTITKWSNPYDGQRLSHDFLTLFDGEPMSEGFRRNRKEDDLESQTRVTGPVSLSIIFGATLSKCQFASNSERDGMQRRFLYHLALCQARELDRPKPDREWLGGLIRQFERLLFLKGEFAWDSATARRFDQYKKEVTIRLEATDPFDESTRGRLATLCTYALKVAMIFESACLCYDTSWMPADPDIIPTSPPLILRPETLELALSYVEECFNAAQSLCDVASQKVIREQAETLLASIRGDFQPHPLDPGSIVLSRSKLTRAYAHNPKRHSGFSVDELYERIIPYLIRSRDAMLLQKEGKKETYAFRCE
jgi:hypothetical protein